MASLRVASHKAAAPLHAGAICQSSGRYLVRLAVDDATREDAYRLRYESYLAQGHITANPARMFKDPYDNLANDRTVVVYDRRGAIGSVRLCLLASSSAATPGRESFPAEVERLLNRIRVDRGHVAAEITRLVRSPAASGDAGLVFLLYRLANYVGHHENVSLLLASARRNHAIFYRRLGFSIETEPRPYPGLTCLMQLLSCDRSAYEESFTHFPMIVPVAAGLPSLNGLLSGKVVEVPSLSQRYAPRPIQSNRLSAMRLLGASG